MIIQMYISGVTNVEIRVGQEGVERGLITTIGCQLDETIVFSGDHRQIAQL